MFTGIKWSCGVRRAHVLSFYISLFAVMVGCVRANAYVRQHISDDVVMHEVFKGEVLDFIGIGRTKNCILLCESRQDWFGFCCDVQDLHATCQCYEEGPMGENRTVSIFWRNKTFYSVKWKLRGWAGGV